MKKKEPYGKTAILFRTDIGISSLVYRLNEYNIPYIINGSVQDLFEHWAVQDICAYLKLAEAERPDTDDFLRIMNRPKGTCQGTESVPLRLQAMSGL